MKKQFFITISTLLLLTCFSTALSAQGIIFKDGSFDNILVQAKKEGKFIFIDVFTAWCGPCKEMSNKVFPAEEVGRVFNEQFINYKLDAEKGEGPAIAKKYGVNAYPTMLFLDGEGKVVNRLVGYRNATGLLEEAQALSQAKKFGGIEQMRADLKNGRNEIDFLVEFFKLLPEKDNLKREIASRYLLHVPEERFMSESSDDISINREMLALMKNPDNKIYDHFLDLIEKKKTKEGEQFSRNKISVLFLIELGVGDAMRDYINAGNEAMLEQSITFQRQYQSLTGCKTDGDINIQPGRRLFFASPEFLRLRYLSANDNDRETFKKRFSTYMDSLMKVYPIAEIKQKNYLSDGRIEMIKSSDIARSTFVYGESNRRAISTDYMVDWVKYFWRISPNDKKTKKQVGEWLDYTVLLNPANLDLPIKAAPLLVKTGYADQAVQHLQTTLDIYHKIGIKNNRQLTDIKILIEEIKNDKL